MDEQRELSAIRAVKRGDGEAFRVLVDAYKDRIYALAWRMVRDRHEAEDLAQEAFLRAYSAMERFDESQPFSHWMLKITSNLCINRMRKKKPAPMAIEPEAEPPGVRASAAPDPDQLSYRQLKESVEEELRKLPEPQRAAFVLFHQEELPYERISELLGRPVGTIKSDLHRARKQLMTVLKKSEMI